MTSPLEKLKSGLEAQKSIDSFKSLLEEMKVSMDQENWERFLEQLEDLFEEAGVRL